MTKFRKFTAVLLSLVMAVTAMAVLTVSASAGSELKTESKSISLNKKVSVPTNKSTNYYTFTIKEESDVWIEYTTYTSWVYVCLYNEDGRGIGSNHREASIGYIWNDSDCHWNETQEKGQGRIRYTLKPGVYYIELFRHGDSGTSKFFFTVTAPVDESAEIDYLTLTLKEGMKVKLGTVLTTNSKKTVKWTSSNKTVASVTSKGTLTAKAEGTTVITAKVGDSTLKVKVKVTES